MGVMSGSGGAVNGAHTVRSWNVRTSSDNKQYRASNTKKGTGRKAGTKDWSGSYLGYGVVPPVMPNEAFTFTGFDGAKVASGSAVVESVEIRWSQEDGGLMEYTVNFSGAGPLSKTTGTASDVVIPNPPSSVSLKLELDSVELADVRSMTLTLTGNTKAYSSSTSGGWKGRLGGSLDASGGVEFYHADIESVPDAGTDTVLKMYVDDTTFWEIKWGQIDEDGVDVSIEDDELVSGTILWSKNGFQDGVEGYIKKPDLTTLWPAA